MFLLGGLQEEQPDFPAAIYSSKLTSEVSSKEA
jgi:hypothetical protein